MNEEEKKAFEELSKKAVLCNYEERDYPNMICFKNDMLNEKYTINLTDKQYNAVIENAQNDINQKWIQKVKDKIEEIQKEYNKLDKQVDEYIRNINKDVSTYYENKERIAIMQTLMWFIDVLQELIEEREEK